MVLRFLSKKHAFLFSLGLACLVAPGAALADHKDNPPPLSGWVHAQSYRDDSPMRHGVPLEGNDVNFSSPAVGEIDGNAANGREVAVGSSDGTISVYRSDGSLLWTAKTPNAGCGGSGGNNKLLSSPAVGDIHGNGQPAVVVGYGGVGGRVCGGGVVSFRGSDGSVDWHFDLKRFAKKARFGTFSHAVFSSPALADSDGDGKMEVAFGSFDRNVYLLNHNGSVRFYYNAADTIWSSPAFANVDGTPDLELIVSTDISANSRLKPATKNGGFVYAFKTKQRRPSKIPFRLPGSYLWQTYLDQVLYSSPVVADVLPSSPGPEVLIGSGCFFPQSSNQKGGRWVKILRASDGKVLRTLDAPTCFSSSVAVGDLNDDGKLEVVAVTNGSPEIGGDGSSRVIAWDPESSAMLWSVIPRERGRNDPYAGNFLSPAIADIDGNGSLEVLVSNNASIVVLNGRDGSALTCQGAGSCEGKEYMLYAWKPLRSSPAVSDLNGDGILDIIVAGGHSFNSSRGMVYTWTNLKGLLGSPQGAQAPYSAPWPCFRGDSQHTGRMRQ